MSILDIVLKEMKEDGSLERWKEKNKEIKEKKQRKKQREPINYAIYNIGEDVLGYSLWSQRKNGRTLEKMAELWKTTTKDIERRIKKYEQQESLS